MDKIKKSLLILLILVSNLEAPPLQANEEPLNLYINEKKVEPSKLATKDIDYLSLKKQLTKDSNDNTNQFCQTVKAISTSGDLIELYDGSMWSVSSSYKEIVKNWNTGNQVKVSYSYKYFFTSLHVSIMNIDQSNDSIKAELESPPTITDAIHKKKSMTKVSLASGNTFKRGGLSGVSSLRAEDPIVVLHDGSKFALWNPSKNKIYTGFSYSGEDGFHPESVLQLEEKLNKRVLAQPEASNTIATAIMNYASGLKDPETPVGVFLFLGPTGVGKTELAKVLCDELYGNKNLLVRFDMSHFSEKHSGAKLIGSPPGYVNHQEGGQLTNPLKKNSNRIVLLDEMEKAHPEVRKIFLPVFDEGHLSDNKGNAIDCTDTIFIMTSNLCAMKITELFANGYSAEEVLEQVEHSLMETLSPELYNRVEPVLFNPLSKSTIEKLVDMMLDEVDERLKTAKKINFIADQTVKNYLGDNGYHPDLGARPLKKLIEKKVVSSIAYAIIKEGIPEGSTVTLFYAAGDNTWHVKW